MLEEFGHELLLDYSELSLVPLDPVDFDVVTLEAFTVAIAQPEYWLSLDELLFLGDVAEQRIIIFEETAERFQYAGRTLAADNDLPIALVPLASHRRGVVLSGNRGGDLFTRLPVGTLTHVLAFVLGGLRFIASTVLC